MSEQLITTPGVFGENGNFLLERELGAGGMGGVYMGRDKMLDRPVAVKVMLRELGTDLAFVEKFKKEAQSVARLIHPNIAQVYSFGVYDGMPYIAMELAAGGSLFTIMNANPGKADVPRVLKICQQVAQALQCASDQGFVHGDVKPENILLDANGNAKLVDFGLAAMQKDTDEIWGTPYYISPEKVKKEPVDYRADMYSLGGTLYHALTGVAPFEGEDSIAVVRKRFEGTPKKPSELRSELTPAVDELVMKMLAFNKEDRYPTFEALLEAFKAVLTTGLSTGASPAAPTTKTTKTTMTTTGGHKRVVMRSRRTTMMVKKPSGAGVAPDDAEKKIDGENAENVLPVPEVPPENDEEEEGDSHLALKISLVIVGIIVAIGGIVGGLIWYRASSKSAAITEHQNQIVAAIAKTKVGIKETAERAKKFADEFDAFANRAVEECEKPHKELFKILPSDEANRLKPEESQDLQAAKALKEGGGEPKTDPAAPAAVKTATTNAVAKAAAAPAVKAPEPAKAAAPQPELPPTIAAMHELWNRTYACQAAAIRIRLEIEKLLAKADPDNLTGPETREHLDKLTAIYHELTDGFDQIKSSKDVETVRKNITFIKTKGEKTVEQAVKRLRIEKLEHDRKEKAEAAAAAEKERKEKAEAEKREKIEAETKAAKDKFEAIAAQGCLRQLDWKSALRQLNQLKDETKTAEGQLAIEIELRKVKAMKSVQDILIKRGSNFEFKTSKAKRSKITTINEKEIILTKADGKSKIKLSWPKFYREYPGNFNELLNTFIVNARHQNSKHKLNLRDWAEAMTGAALTLRLVCNEINNAVQRGNELAQETAKEFPEYVEFARQVFPDIEFADAPKEE